MMETPISLRSLLLCSAASACIALVSSGCHRPATPEGAALPAQQSATKTKPVDAEPPAGGAEDEPDEALHLKPEEVAKLGVAVQAVRTVKQAPEASGFGIVVAHETIAQALADLRTAAAVARQSQSAFERGQRLSTTPGAMPLDTQEAAERQTTVDKAALDLARQRLTSAFGQQAPWNGRNDSPLLDALAGGRTKLVRITFPMSTLIGVPAMVRLGRIGTGPTAKTWDARPVWNASADSTVPGRSFFTLLKSDGIEEGERLIAWAAVGEPDDGVLIPASAALISRGKYWCYVVAKPGTFVRTEFDPSMPMNGGYFVKTGIEAGASVVVVAAGQLLAKELNPSTEAE